MGPSKCDLLSSLLYGVSIIVEIVDKVVDGFIVDKYNAGEISNDFREAVYFSLFAFLVLGIIITAFRVVISGCRIVTLCCEGDCSKGRTDRTIKIWMTLAKVWSEALPQTIITHFYFGNCSTANDLKIWGIAFSIFSLIPFIKYIFHLFSYCYFHGCDCDDVPNPLWALAIITLIPSVVGAYFAYKSIMAFDNLCTPQ